MRKRLKYHACHFNEIEMYLKIFSESYFIFIKHRLTYPLFISDIISRNLNGAEHIANRKCLRIEFYKILLAREPVKEDIVAEILRNLTGKPKGISCIQCTSLIRILIT